MQLGMVGLGKMGANMTRRLLEGGHDLIVTDLNPDAVAAAELEGAIGAHDLATLAQKLNAPRAVWVMVPSGAPTDHAVMQLANLLAPGDVIVDGGNSNYKETMR